MALKAEMSKTYQYRKVVKPLLERKRRARINKCLDELKDLMIECLTHEGEHITRLEKADILELTVEHLRKLKYRKQQNVTESFRSGYIQAANEVSKALSVTPGVDLTLGTKLMTHLGHRLNIIQTTPPIVSPVNNTSSPNYTAPLTVVCGSTYISPMSPASSGYDSEPESMESSSEGLLKVVPSPKESVWRPW